MVRGYEQVADHNRNGNQSRQVSLFVFYLFIVFVLGRFYAT